MQNEFRKPNRARTKELSTKELIKIGQLAAKIEQSELRAANIPLTYAFNNDIIKELPDGSKIIIGHIPQTADYTGPRKIKIG